MARFRGGSFELRYDINPEEAIKMVNNSLNVISGEAVELNTAWGVRVTFDAQQDLTEQENWMSFQGKWASVFSSRDNPPQPISYQAYSGTNATSFNAGKAAMANNTTDLFIFYQKSDSLEDPGAFYVTFANLGVDQLLAAERIFRISVGDKTDITNLGHIISNEVEACPRLYGYGERKYDYVRDTEGSAPVHYLSYKVVPPLTRKIETDGTWNWQYPLTYGTTQLDTIWNLIKTNIDSYTSVSTSDTTFFGTAGSPNVSLVISDSDKTVLEAMTAWDPYVYSMNTLGSTGVVGEVVLRILDVNNIPDVSDTLIKIEGTDNGDGTSLNDLEIAGEDITLDTSDVTVKDVEAITMKIVDTINSHDFGFDSSSVGFIKAEKYGARSVVISMRINSPEAGTPDYVKIFVRNGVAVGTDGVVEHPIFDLETRGTTVSSSPTYIINGVDVDQNGPGDYMLTENFDNTYYSWKVNSMAASDIDADAVGVAVGDSAVAGTYPGSYDEYAATNPVAVLKKAIAYTYDNVNEQWNVVSNTLSVRAHTGTDNVTTDPQPGDIPSRVIKFQKMCSVFERCAIPQYLLESTLKDLIYRIYEEGEDY